MSSSRKTRAELEAMSRADLVEYVMTHEMSYLDGGRLVQAATADGPARCNRCQTLLPPCSVCGQPSQCGDTLCWEHTF